MARRVAYGRCLWIICCNDSTLHHRHFLFAGRNHLGNLQVGDSLYQLTVMQTKFKWTDKQRLLFVNGLSLGVSMAPSLEIARKLGEDIYFLAKAPVEQINSDERIQQKLKTVFQLQIILGPNNLYEQFLALEKDEETDSFAA